MQMSYSERRIVEMLRGVVRDGYSPVDILALADKIESGEYLHEKRAPKVGRPFAVASRRTQRITLGPDELAEMRHELSVTHKSGDDQTSTCAPVRHTPTLVVF